MAVCVPAMAHDNVATSSRTLVCLVHFLDNSEATFDCDKKEKGQALLDRVFKHLELKEGDYFGLQFVDSSNTDEVDQKAVTSNHLHSEDLRWLDPGKPVKKQLRGPPYLLYFRVKFYVPDPGILREESTRYQFFLQLSKDMSEGRLVAPFKTTVLLASLAVQSELGDFNEEEHKEDYLAEFCFVPNQSDELLQEVASMHKKHRGLSPATCEKIYIDTARYLDCYGMNPFSATWDQNNEEIQLVVLAQGLVVFQNNLKLNTFFWSKINKVSFKRKQFFIHQRKESGDNVENVFGFNMASYRACKNLWKSCVEYHTFFCSRAHSTNHISDDAKQDIMDMSYGSTTNRMVGRQSGTNGINAGLVAMNKLSISAPESNQNFQHPSSNINCSATTINLANPSSWVSTSFLQASTAANQFCIVSHINHETNIVQPAGYRSCPSVQISADSVMGSMLQSNGANGIISPILVATNCHRHSPNGRTFTTTSLPKGFTQRPLPLETEAIQKPAAVCDEMSNIVMARSLTLENASSSLTTSMKHCHVNSVSDQSSSSSSFDNDTGNAVSNTHSLVANMSAATARITALSDPCISYTDSERSPTEFSYELQSDASHAVTAANESAASTANAHNLVSIRIKPDENGRFGFNVKGGCDQSMPVIVSRVAPGTPADLCIPRLSEGDQVLFVNGRDISQHTHAQVVQFIRASCEMHSGELVLVVRQNVYLGDEDSPSEPDFQYIPDTPSLNGQDGDPLVASMVALREGLENGSVLSQFEQLYRKKPGMTMDISQLPDNVGKNRYRDISPYDQTRVKLKGLTHDYINANYINMEIPGSGIINRYIAAQGPLPETSGDFWHMVWEQRSSLVVMLTTNMERGRVKCHQYWPNLNRTVQFGNLTLTCLSEISTSQSFVFRDFSLTDNDDETDNRRLCQMQYLSWPDHGVPEDCSGFLDFVGHVRLHRAGVVEPTVVHCSAGIGRTGVLIAMETAMCLIEANQPVSMVDIVRQMRDQRAMLIQTTSQYKFVCEALLKVYDGMLHDILKSQFD